MVKFIERVTGQQKYCVFACCICGKEHGNYEFARRCEDNHSCNKDFVYKCGEHVKITKGKYLDHTGIITSYHREMRKSIGSAYCNTYMIVLDDTNMIVDVNEEDLIRLQKDTEFHIDDEMFVELTNISKQMFRFNIKLNKYACKNKKMDINRCKTCSLFTYNPQCDSVVCQVNYLSESIFNNLETLLYKLTKYREDNP